jgi:hypothetical protein
MIVLAPESVALNGPVCVVRWGGALSRDVAARWCLANSRFPNPFPLSHLLDTANTRETPINFCNLLTENMSATDEYDDSANGQTGPGAPTPLQALEVSALRVVPQCLPGSATIAKIANFFGKNK